MAKALHAIDYLAAPDEHPPRPVCVAFGNEPFLRRQVLARLRKEVLPTDDADFSFASFDGRKAELRDVLDELATVAMFGGQTRLVLVEDADDFVTRYRGDLEDYVARPSATGVLVLEVKSWPSNTRLYKSVASGGLPIDCSAPKAAQLTRWLVNWAKQVHGVKLASPAADLLVEMVGPELGLLNQEVAKLALTAAPGGKIAVEAVTRSVGSWRAKTTWVMLDAALAGNARDALVQLDRLILAGEHPIAILAQISSQLRRLAAATQLVLRAESLGRRMAVGAALEQAGVKRFVLQKAEQQLRRLGRHRGAQLYRWLLQADLDLKGASLVDPRLILERLIVRLAAPQPGRAAASGAAPAAGR